MEESDEFIQLLAARQVLRSSIEKSKDIALAVNETGSRLEETNKNLAVLQAAMGKMSFKWAVHEIKDHADRAIRPSAAVLNVLDVVYELQDALQIDPRAAGLFIYLNNIKRLDEALKLLADNCRLVEFWLADLVQFLKNNAAAAEYRCLVEKVLRILEELQGKGRSFRRVGGVLSSAFDKLENEYRRLLTENSLAHQWDFSVPCYEDKEIDVLPFPEPVIQEVQAIIEVLAANDRLHQCISIHAGIRAANAQATLRALNLDYLDIQVSETVSVQTVEAYIDQWDLHMEYVVRHLLRYEYRLCNEVYKKAGSDVWMNCFSEIAAQCGFSHILGFGSAVCRSKKEAVKLLKLLQIFSTLDKLRLDLNELFGGKSCIQIQNQTRDLVKEVVDMACEIFWELAVQVELQRASSPPLDGSVPRLVCFVIEYCNQLLEDENSSILIRVLEIYQLWNPVRFGGGLLSNEILKIMKALELNLEAWGKRYNDTALSCIFKMNSHWYMLNSISETKLGDLMGHSRLWAYEKSVEYCTALYMRTSWEKLLLHLREEGLTLFPGGRAVDLNVVKKRIGVFCEGFGEMYKKQSKWIVCDESLRLKTCQLIVEAIVPPYRSYVQRFMPGLEYDVDTANQVEYTLESLENLIGLLFEPKLGKYGSRKCTDSTSTKIAASSHFSSTPAVA